MHLQLRAAVVVSMVRESPHLANQTHTFGNYDTEQLTASFRSNVIVHYHYTGSPCKGTNNGRHSQT